MSHELIGKSGKITSLHLGDYGIMAGGWILSLGEGFGFKALGFKV